MGVAVVAFFPLTVIVEGVSEVIADKVFLSLHRTTVTATVEYVIWLGLIYLIIRPIAAALLVATLYAVLAHILERLIPQD